MNPVNATSLYVSASRSVLQCDPRDPRALAELCKLLPFFRQSLSCLVCGNLLQDPIAPTDSSCQHYVCRGCKGQRMQLKPSCSWCKDYSRFQENRQLSLLVRCYRRLCLYIAQSPLAPHIASAAGGSPDLRAVLSEGLALAEGEPGAEEPPEPPDPSPPAEEEEEEEEAAKGAEPGAAGVNGLHGCNGLTGSGLSQRGEGVAGGVAKQERLAQEGAPLPAANEASLCLSDKLKHHTGGGPLLLSVEEVIRTLETDPPQPGGSSPPSSTHHPSLNGARCPLGPAAAPSRLTPSLPTERSPCPPNPHPPAVTLAPLRSHRKRSRSESDSEKLQPLPIASLLQGAPPPITASSSPHHPTPAVATAKQEPPKFPAPAPSLPHLAPVPNGGPPKVGKTVLLPSKPLKKTVEHHGGPRKAYAKARQGAPKPRAPARDRAPPTPPPPLPLTQQHSHPLAHPPSPSKPLYKKPVEKKGCKCGRATQNPSVLTCRGQRCPCYSNRKACLDCICRGCQNSYMANGEKKLEAFAVPEKALEQTRLTLGINLTSITAAAVLRGPAASSPGGTGAGSGLLSVGSPAGGPSVTAAFLSGAGHDSRGFDDSLEMRFDC